MMEREQRTRQRQSSVDVVIPTYKPDGKFEELLARMGKQDCPVRNIYVIDTLSGRFPEHVAELPGVTVVHIGKDEFDHGGTRNRGFAMSDADIVVFMTQDAVPADRHLIGHLIRPLEEHELVGVSYARQLPAEDCDPIERYTRRFNYPAESRIKGREDIPELGIKTFFCSNVCAAYRRDVFEKMGGFPDRTVFNEDMILAGRMVLAGYQIAYTAQARVIHSHNYSGRQQFRRNLDLAVSQVRHPEVFEHVRSVDEGVRLVKSTAAYLVKSGRPYLLPALIYRSGCKYLGYKTGRICGKLSCPKFLIAV